MIGPSFISICCCGLLAAAGLRPLIWRCWMMLVTATPTIRIR